jgi:hypothetical protein
MKLTIRRNRKRRTTSITFRAETNAEGVALKDAVLAAAREGFEATAPPTA